jgi:pimeloyl-ACP methyl ester carboxylesterase
MMASCGGPPVDSAEEPNELVSTTATTETVATSTASVPSTVIGVVCGHELVAGFVRIPCEGVTFNVATPEICSEEACGLIVDVHGDTASGAGADLHTGLRERGNAAGYVVVQPNAPGTIWDHEVDDDHIRSFLDQLIDGLKLDRNRVHFGGFSRGGWMTWRFVCNHADLIASAAPAGAGASYPEDPLGPGVSCNFDLSGFPSEEIDILFVHGRSDFVVPFETALLQRDLVIENWEMTETDILADEPDYRWTRWASSEGTVFEFLEHDWQSAFLGGHCYPGASGSVGCGPDTPVSYGEAVLQFYIDHPKNEGR